MRDLYAEVTSKIVAALEAGTPPWWPSHDIPDTFDRWDDDIGGVQWKGRSTAQSSSERQ